MFAKLVCRTYCAKTFSAYYFDSTQKSDLLYKTNASFVLNISNATFKLNLGLNKFNLYSDDYEAS